MTDLGAAVSDAARKVLDALIEHVPDVVGAILLAILGWILARLLRSLASRVVRLVEALVERTTGRPVRLGDPRIVAAFGAVVFWVVLLVFITVATQMLGLVIFTDWLARLLAYLPTLLAGLLIVGAGLILSRFVADLVDAAAKRLAGAQRTALARLAQAATLLAALLVGAEQIGIRVTWIAILVAIVVASVFGGVALAISLGARTYVSNLIGAHYLRQAFQIGQRVRVAGYEGRILDVTATSLVIETEDGRLALPGRIFHDEPILLVANSSNG
jgi:small-conductance mechanosensitive channel